MPDSKRKILIADDDVDICMTLKEILAFENYSVSMVHNGLEAIDAVDKASYDWVFLDIKMPGIGGMEALERIAGKDKRQKVAIITGYYSEELKKEAMEKGARIVLGKPFNIDIMFDAIKS